MNNVDLYIDHKQRLEQARREGDAGSEEKFERLTRDLEDNVLTSSEFDDLTRQGYYP